MPVTLAFEGERDLPLTAVARAACREIDATTLAAMRIKLGLLPTRPRAMKLTTKAIDEIARATGIWSEAF